MLKNKTKKILLLLVIIGSLFALSGCTIPTEVDEETGKKVTKIITTETTFKETRESEGWYQTFLVYPLAQSINKLSPVVSVAGAIALVTFLVNFVVFIFTYKATLAQQKMAAMQPEINRITEKYKGKTDQASRMAQAQEQQKLYKKYNINPFSSLLIQFIQLPIIISIYYAVQRSQAVKHGFFMGMELSVSPLNGIMNKEWIYLVLLIIVMGSQALSMKLPTYLAEKQARKEAEEQGRRYRPAPNPTAKMMNYMLVFITVITITLPSGMGVYWVCSSLMAIAKSLITMHLSKKEKMKGSV
ncbi:MAG: membrane protein insertase YidC [Anaerorhabdus sp.]